MERAEYMRLRGELSVATEALNAVRVDKRKAQDALQGWANKLHSEKVTQESAASGHDLIDKLLSLQQQESAVEAQEAQFKRALSGAPVPPAV